MNRLATLIVVGAVSTLYSQALHPHSQALVLIDAWNTTGISMISIAVLSLVFRGIGRVLSPLAHKVQRMLP